MTSKPCPRVGQPHCLGTITDRDAWHLARRRTCSKRCAWHWKASRGIRPHEHVTPAGSVKRRAGAVKGARIAADRRHRSAMTRAVSACADLIPAEFERELSARALALVKALIGRGFERGRLNEVRRQDLIRRRQNGEAA